MRVIGYSLGSEGSTLYRSNAGDFFLYPHPVGEWFLIFEPSWEGDDTSHFFPTRRDAIEFIEDVSY